VGYYDTPGSAYGVAVVDRYIYMADYSAGLQIYERLPIGIKEHSGEPVCSHYIRLLQNPVQNGFIRLSLVPGNQVTKQPGNIAFDLYNIAGQKVAIFRKLLSGSGGQEIKLPTKNLASGIYFLKVTTSADATRFKVVLAK